MTAPMMSLGEFYFIQEFREGLAPKPKPKARKSTGGNPTVARTGRDVRLQHLARRLHQLGERPLFEFLSEIESGADLRSRLERYAQLDPELIRELGGDTFSLGVFDGARTC
jgi:hypothetical protein